MENKFKIKKVISVMRRRRKLSMKRKNHLYFCIHNNVI